MGRLTRSPPTASGVRPPSWPASATPISTAHSSKPAAAEAPKPAAAAAAPAAVGWYTLSGWAASAAHDGDKPSLVRAPAQWVKVDDQPVPELASGQWVTLSAGKHRITFQPALGLGVGPKTWTIDLTPQGHLDQKIPLTADSK